MLWSVLTEMALYKMLTIGQISFLNTFAKCWNVHQRSVSKSRMISELLGHPSRPRRPLNPFLKFAQDCRPEISAQCPGKGASEIVKLLAKQWSEMPEGEKEKYIKEFEEERTAYKKKLEEYKKSLSTVQKEEIQQLQAELKASKTRETVFLIKNKIKKELNKPKTPMSSFFRFCQKSGFRNGQSASATIKDLARAWKNLPEKEKEKYKNEYEVEYEQYLKSLEKWERQMLQEGNVEVIRLKTLKEMLQQS